MHKFFIVILGFLLFPLSLGFCEDLTPAGSKEAVPDLALTDISAEQIIKEEWDKTSNSKKWPQYSPSSISMDEKVLGEKPLMASHRALIADEREKELQTKLPSVPDLPKEFDQAISLKGKMKLSEALKLLSKTLNRNLVLGPLVQDTVIDVSLENVQVWRGLTSVLYPLGYGFKINDGGDLVVLAQETRMFRINLPPVIQQLDSVTTNETLSGGESNGSSSGSSNNNNSNNSSRSSQKTRVGTRVVVENKSESLSFWKDIDLNLREMLQGSDKYSLNKIAGMAMVQGSPGTLDKVSAYFQELNKRISQQIIVDVKVVEVTLNNDYKNGIDWAYLNGKTNISTNFATQNITDGSYLTLLSGNQGAQIAKGFSVLLRALDTFGKTEVLSQPRVMLLNNTVANIQVGQSRGYVDSYITDTTQTGTTVTATLNEVQGGVTLQLIGNIVGDDIYLNVTPVVSTIDSIRTIALGSNGRLEAPDTSMKSISSMVKVREGQTAVIGGLITHNNTDTTTGIPLLNKIPFGIGKNLFSFHSKNTDKTELVIFITPRKG